MHVALRCQGDRQPDGGRVEDRRQVIGQVEVGQTPAARHPVAVETERVEGNVAGRRQQARQHVGHSHGNEQRAVGVAHRAPQQDGTDETVGRRRHGDDNRMHKTANSHVVRRPAVVHDLEGKSGPPKMPITRCLFMLTVVRLQLRQQWREVNAVPRRTFQLVVPCYFVWSSPIM